MRVPKYVLKNSGIKTQRQWKELKRRQLRAAFKAMRKFQGGCYYTPDKGQYCQVMRGLEQLKDMLSVKKWGR